MFMSVKERARQIASGQFSQPTTSAPDESLIDLAPEPKPATPGKKGKNVAKEAPPKAAATPSKTKASKAAAPKESTPKVKPSQKAPPEAAPLKATPIATAIGAFPKTPTSKTTTPPPEAPTPKKSSSKSKSSKEPSKPSSPKIGSSKSSSSSKVTPQPKVPSSPKVAPPTKASSSTKSTSSKPSSTPSKSKRSKSPPKRVDSPLEDDDDPLSALKSACLKQVSGVTGLGGRRLAIVLKQRSTGEWYAALKDTGSDKYLKMWMNREKTFATKQEALEAYLVFATKMKNGVSWFPMSPRASSPKGKK
ncbi:uncharacterized protein N0V89_011705 [Didymosphaeria variabile]|uniref:Uncharacterized protein n=1 Tax=Didymosphaeria variabile TaxID=1932322 RepID=A0A9W9C5K3_9PLEO|nr:uncharacterized protein N0V89_011705 [Didymosphaeria variabile]KAJ4345572.1 hypothetical protein N0V89_011705 [Didymosphaeria variabile]